MPEAMQRRYGSRSTARKEAGKVVAEALVAGAVRETASPLRRSIQELAVIAANEVYAESAVADPLRDLACWHDWTTGTRSFPHPGQFLPLGITGQDSKQVARNAVGALGEAIAGLYAQRLIAPSPQVRVVGRWPDLIYYRDDVATFLEAKATSSTGDEPRGLAQLIDRGLLQESMVDALQEFGADPSVRLCFVFTDVRVNGPEDFEFDTLIVDVSGPEERRAAVKPRPPEPLIRGLAERAIGRALATEAPRGGTWNLMKPAKVTKGQQKSASADSARIASAASREAEDLLKVEVGDSPALLQCVVKEVERLSDNVQVDEKVKERRLEGLKRDVSTELRIERVRTFWNHVLVTVPLKDHEVWTPQPTWTGTDLAEPEKFEGHDFYRAGGNLYGVLTEVEFEALMTRRMMRPSG